MLLIFYFVCLLFGFVVVVVLVGCVVLVIKLIVVEVNIIIKVVGYLDKSVVLVSFDLVLVLLVVGLVVFVLDEQVSCEVCVLCGSLCFVQVGVDVEFGFFEGVNYFFCVVDIDIDVVKILVLY